MPMQMPMQNQPHEISWEEFIEQLKIQIANTEKRLLMTKAQLEEAKSHVGEDKNEGK